MDEELTHLDSRGRAQMVDISGKPESDRLARAHARLRMKPATREALLSGRTPKGDVWATARIAGIQAAKRVPELIPLCHSVALSRVSIDFECDERFEGVLIYATAQARDRTGVEMEALTAVSVAALTLYDMLKAIDRSMTIESVELLEKRGGTRGPFVREP